MSRWLPSFERARLGRPTSPSALTRRFIRAWLLGSWLVVLSSLSGCDGEITTVPRTQLTVRLYASQEVSEGMAALRVSTFSGTKLVETHMFGRGELTKWPVDLPIIPDGSNDSSELVEFVAEAVDAQSRPLVQQRALASFVPREKHVLEVFLARCGALPLGQLCEPNPACRGDKCLTCAASASCAPAPALAGAMLPVLNPGEQPVSKSAPWEDASVLASDAGPLPMHDSGVDAGFDAGADAGPDATIDAATDGGADRGDGGPPQWDGGKFWCGDSFYWVPTFASGVVPAGAPVLAMPEITPVGDQSNPGPRNQYICRVAQADGSRITGKANGLISGPNAGKLDYGCYFARFQPESQAWKGEGVDTEGVSFQIFVPPDICKLSWVKASAGQVLPKNALILATDARFQPYYACRFEVSQPQSTGLHIGRVSGNLGDVCRMQFWGDLLQSEKYEVLVQDFPPATD
jgi:hypothetical protein